MPKPMNTPVFPGLPETNFNLIYFRYIQNLDFNNGWRYYPVEMIKTFKDKETQKIFQREYSRKLPSDIQKTALKKLWMLNAAPDLQSLRVPPANRLESLSGNRTGQYSIRINDQWRICFNWQGENAFDVEIVDYH